MHLAGRFEFIISISNPRFVVHKLGKGKYMVQSIPGELSMEETNILNAASNTESGYVTQRQLMEDLG